MNETEFSQAAMILGWDLSEVVQVRDLAALPAAIAPAARIVVRCQSASEPSEIAHHLRQAGLGWSVLTLIEHLGEPNETTRSQMAEFFALTDIDAQCVCAISVGVLADGQPTSNDSSGPWG